MSVLLHPHNKLQVMQNAALRTGTQDTNIQHLHDETLTLPIHELPTAPDRLKKPTIFNNGRYTTNIPTDPHTVTTTDTKTNMRHIHTSIVSRHLATRGNNKILPWPEGAPRLSHPCPTQNKQISIPEIILTQSAKTHP